MNAPVDFLKPVQQALLEENFLHFQVYIDQNYYKEKTYITVGGKHFNSNSKYDNGNGFLVYLGKKKIWTGVWCDRKFTLSTRELVELIHQWSDIEFTYPKNKVIRDIKEMVL